MNNKKMANENLEREEPLLLDSGVVVLVPASNGEAVLSSNGAFRMELQSTRSITKHPTTYFETLIHLFKGNIGSGVFAMGDAFKNAGLLLGPVLTLFLGIICVYGNHMLLDCAKIVQLHRKMDYCPSFPETVQMCFEDGAPRFRTWATFARRVTKISIITTQLGFCCVYFVFVSYTIKIVLDSYGYSMDVHLLMATILIPIILSTLIRNLKFLTPISMLANVLIASGIFLTLWISSASLPPISSRRLISDWHQLPLFFGTAVYSFEGISLVLPLQKEMKNSKHFSSPFGVLNVGMSAVGVLLIAMGFIGYLKYGDDVKGSLTVNLPQGHVFSQCVQIAISLGILLSYAIQFYVAANLIWDDINDRYGPFKHHACYERSLRVVLVLFTFLLAEIVPKLGLFISLVGAVSSSTLALLMPPLCDMAMRLNPESLHPFKMRHLIFDAFTIVIAILGFITGTFYSLKEIISAFFL